MSRRRLLASILVRVGVALTLSAGATVTADAAASVPAGPLAKLIGNNYRVRSVILRARNAPRRTLGEHPDEWHFFTGSRPGFDLHPRNRGPSVDINHPATGWTVIALHNNGRNAVGAATLTEHCLNGQQRTVHTTLAIHITASARSTTGSSTRATRIDAYLRNYYAPGCGFPAGFQLRLYRGYYLPPPPPPCIPIGASVTPQPVVALPPCRQGGPL